MSDTKKCYITAHSLICNLGDTTRTIAKNAASLNQENYEAHIAKTLKFALIIVFHTPVPRKPKNSIPSLIASSQNAFVKQTSAKKNSKS